MKYFFIVITSAVLFSSLLISCFSTEKNTESGSQDVEEVDPLPSWNTGEIKNSIIAYVKDVTNQNNDNFIAVKDRIATFDNDGTLWSEQPMYTQLMFAVDQIKAMEVEHPEWRTLEPYKYAIEGDLKSLASQGKKGIAQIVMATHGGLTTDEFDQHVADWISTAKHPETNRLYTQMIFQPMLELIQYLQSNDFKIFIVSGGGVEFMRVWVEETYGIPKNQIIGTTTKSMYNYNDGKPVINRLDEIEFIDDHEGKPVGIHKNIGRKPIFAAGNSDGDLDMLRWTDSNPLNTFQLYIHHTDSEREWAYDRNSFVGKLDKGLDEARTKNWAIVDMKADWKLIHPQINN